MPLMWLAPNIFRTDVSLMTGTFPHLSTVLQATFVTWALSHWHLFLRTCSEISKNLARLEILPGIVGRKKNTSELKFLTQLHKEQTTL